MKITIIFPVNNSNNTIVRDHDMASTTSMTNVNGIGSLNVTVTMLSPKTASLIWTPEDAFLGKDFEIVYSPDRSK